MRMDRREFLGRTAAAGLVAASASAQDSLEHPWRAWDAHCHVGGSTDAEIEAQIGRLVRLADRMDIERLILFIRSTPAAMRACERWRSRCYGFVLTSGADPERALEDLERAVAQGPMVGLKMPGGGRRCTDPGLLPLFRRAAALKAPIYQHAWIKAVGNFPGESTPQDVAGLAARLPEAAILMGHAGGDWERGIRIARPHPNVSVELGGGDPTSGLVEMAVRELGAERVVYGSDVSGRNFGSQLAKVHGAAVPDASKFLILGGNLRRMLGPILAEKGFVR